MPWTVLLQTSRSQPASPASSPPASMPMAAACATSPSTKPVQWAKREGHVVWIGLKEPSAELLERVQAQLDLHPLAIEDAAKAHQYPKLERYGDAFFIVARTAQLSGGEIIFGETHIFFGKGYVVSVRHGASTSYAAVRQRAESCPTLLKRGEDYILYAILDFIVDNYLPVVEIDPRGGRRARGTAAAQVAARERGQPPLQAAARAAAPAQGGGAAGRGLPAAPACRRRSHRTARCSRSSATSPTT